jgi:hypothetical protein
MAQDNWLTGLAERLSRSQNPFEVRDIIERLEERYDAYAGPVDRSVAGVGAAPAGATRRLSADAIAG